MCSERIKCARRWAASLTLTATSSPWSVARWICAIEPDATGTSSKDSKTDSMLVPSAASTSRLVWP